MERLTYEEMMKLKEDELYEMNYYHICNQDGTYTPIHKDNWQVE